MRPVRFAGKLVDHVGAVSLVQNDLFRPCAVASVAFEHPLQRRVDKVRRIEVLLDRQLPGRRHTLEVVVAVERADGQADSLRGRAGRLDVVPGAAVSDDDVAVPGRDRLVFADLPGDIASEDHPPFVVVGMEVGIPRRARRSADDYGPVAAVIHRDLHPAFFTGVTSFEIVKACHRQVGGVASCGHAATSFRAHRPG